MEKMKLVCLGDAAITMDLMEPMKELEKYGVDVVLMEDEGIQTVQAFTEIMLKVEREGADACPANRKFCEAAKDADIVAVHLSPVNREVLAAAAKLKYVAVLRSGIENVSEALCRERGIRILNAPGRSAHAVADYTLAMLLAQARNVARSHKLLMEGKWVKKYPNNSDIHDLRNCTVGVVGAGQIGRKVIDRLRGFGCGILVHDPFLPDGELERLGYTPAGLDDLLRQSDFVTLHLRLSEKTARFISGRELGLMKKTACLINTARAGLVDEAALIEALQTKAIGGAALDVFEEEPLGTESPFLRLDNVTITPHLAGTCADTLTNSVEIIKNALEELLRAMYHA